MFTVEIKINGTLVANITGLNITTGVDLPIDYYDYEIYETPSGNRDSGSFKLSEGSINKGSVAHKRDGGVGELVRKILNDIVG